MFRFVMQIRIYILFLAVLLAIPVVASAQKAPDGSKWEMCGLISFTSMARQSQNRLVATTTHGYLYYSTNFGTSWGRYELNDTLCLTDIAFKDSLHCVVTDRTNLAMVSNDGAISWHYFPVPGDQTSLTCACYLPNAIIVGDTAGNIWRSADDNISWKLVAPASHVRINRIYFTDERHGYALGDTATILETVDSGLSWNYIDVSNGNPFDIFNRPINFYAIDFRHGNLGTITGSGAYYTTIDSGKHWTTHIMPSNTTADLRVVLFAGDSEFVALGPNGQRYHSTNFGKTLSVTLLDHIIDLGVTHRAVSDPILGTVAVGDEALIMRSGDYKDWLPINCCSSRGPIEAIGNGIMHCMADIPVTSTDGGIFWYGKNYQTELDFMGLHFTSRDSGFLINSNNFDWLRTTDAGATWINPKLDTNFIPPKHGFVSTAFWNSMCYVGGDTVIWHSSDNGVSWKRCVIPYDGTTPYAPASRPWFLGINQIQAFDSTTAYANLTVTDAIFNTPKGQYSIGNNHSLLFKTTDGGSSWAAMKNSPGINNRSVQFTSSKIGYVPSDSGVIYKTTDGGDSWQAIQFTTAFNNFFFGVKFLNDTVGFICTRYDGVWMTHDGLKTWQKEKVPHPAVYPEPLTFSDFLFPDSNTVLAIANGITGAGFFRKSLGVPMADVPTEPNAIRSSAMTVSVLPNPLSRIGTVSISSVTKEVVTTVELFDITGRKMMTLFSGSSTGEMRFPLDGTHLAAGSYLLRVTANDTVISRLIEVTK
ncbi:MAG TPA: YCF48-related protein [Candidatus Kapabacteria bacterium]|nr:YCF48-related protein [Candidatus Kapabacteria bacterium]